MLSSKLTLLSIYNTWASMCNRIDTLNSIKKNRLLCGCYSRAIPMISSFKQKDRERVRGEEKIARINYQRVKLHIIDIALYIAQKVVRSPVKLLPLNFFLKARARYSGKRKREREIFAQVNLRGARWSYT